MIVTLKYFAWVRERIGLSEEKVELPPSLITITDVLDWLKSRGMNYANAFEKDDMICVALNQRHASKDMPIEQAYELAFFPPITGG